MPKIDYTKDFLEWYSHYPRKVAKVDAFKAWQKQIGNSEDMFNDVAKVAIEDVKKRVRMKWFSPDKTKIPHPATFINQRRWEDEDWQDDINTRGKEHDAAGTTYVPREYIEDTYDCDSWMMFLNRQMRIYIFSAKGVSDGCLESMIKIKNDVHKQNVDMVREEIEIADNAVRATAEMEFVMADLMLAQFDSITGRGFREPMLSKLKSAQGERWAA